MALPFLDAFRHFKCTTDSKDTKRKKGDRQKHKNTEWQRHFFSCSSQLKNFLSLQEINWSQEKISFQRKKFPVTGRNFLSQEEISCHRKKFPFTGRNFRSQEDISGHRKTFPAKEKSFILKDKISSCRKKSLTRRNFKNFCFHQKTD